MEFAYQVRNERGQMVGGTIEADDLNEATRKLHRDGQHIVNLQETGGGYDLLSLDIPILRPRITRKEVCYFASQLAVLVETGVTLATALQGIADQCENTSFARVLAQLCNDVESGQDFSAALGSHPKAFDKTFVQLVRASESTGSLGAMLDRAASHYRRDLETRGKVRAALAYPTIMLFMSIGVSIFLLAYIFPKFTPMFEARSLQLPAPTRVMMAISHVLTNYWYAVIAGAVALVVGVLFARRLPTVRIGLDWLKLYTPMIGAMFRSSCVSRSLRTMSTMINSGVPMLEAIELSGEVSGNVHYENLWRDVAEGVAGGQQICDTLVDAPLIPSVLVQMISAGEQSGKLGPILTRVCDFYDQELESSIKACTAMLEPLMVAFMGIVVGAVAMALLLPIFTLSRHAG